MKFDQVGFHSIEGHALNMVKQINQTSTYAVALAAAHQLLTLHPTPAAIIWRAAHVPEISFERDGMLVWSVGLTKFRSRSPAPNNS